ncbi:MAG: hypothetical protein ORN98_01585, partial [Alphaproteobacteria bacterium]|nr:hypothetical protein [Alphaproteobacteria bacterium]
LNESQNPQTTAPSAQAGRSFSGVLASSSDCTPQILILQSFSICYQGKARGESLRDKIHLIFM